VNRRFSLYLPSDDTYLLLSCLEGYRGRSALEIGTGSGIILNELCKRFSTVVGTDIDFKSLLFCNQTSGKAASLICCDAANALSSREKYDLIISNPPYLPVDKTEIQDRAIHGGITGSDVAIGFVRSAINLLSKTGVILILLSNLSNLPKFHKEITSLGLFRRTISRKKLFFDSLSVEELGLFPPHNFK
jgi:release factor glutamine methyltransferase